MSVGHSLTTPEQRGKKAHQIKKGQLQCDLIYDELVKWVVEISLEDPGQQLLVEDFVAVVQDLLMGLAHPGDARQGRPVRREKQYLSRSYIITTKPKVSKC